MNEFIERLHDDPEATRTALAMAEAIHHHVEDVLTDDPGDCDAVVVVPLLQDAERFAGALTRTLHRVIVRVS
jgi:hypothetical protein